MQAPTLHQVTTKIDLKFEKVGSIYERSSIRRDQSTLNKISYIKNVWLWFAAELHDEQIGTQPITFQVRNSFSKSSPELYWACKHFRASFVENDASLNKIDESLLSLTTYGLKVVQKHSIKPQRTWILFSRWAHW